MNTTQKYELLIKLFNEVPRMEGLTLQGVDPNDPNAFPITPVEFLIEFFNKYNVANPTLNRHGEIVTDIRNGGPVKNRSVQEIYFILTSYFKDYSLEQYFKDIYELVYIVNKRDAEIGYTDGTPIIQSLHLKCFWCPDIQRNIFSYRGNRWPQHFGVPTNTFPIHFVSDSIVTRNLDSESSSGKIWKLMYDEDIQKLLVGNKYIGIAAK